MNVSFGARLRLQREQHGIDLAAIAADTKIKRSLLEALERDDVSCWPEGIYRRSYLRSYARAIGVDPEATVREFMALYPDPVDIAPAVPAITPSDAVPGTGRFRRLVATAMGAVPGLRPTAHGIPHIIDNESQHFAGQYVESTADDAAVVLLSHPSPPSAETMVDETHGCETSVADVIEREITTCQAAAGEAMTLDTAAVEIASARDVAGSDRIAPASLEQTLAVAASLCSRLSCVLERCEIVPLLAEVAAVLDAVGLTLWVWDSRAGALRGSLAHGYPDAVVAAMPLVRHDDGNAVAFAFRSGETCVVDGGADARGAIVVPLPGPGGSVGVLALEFADGAEQQLAVRALAAILAAQFATLLAPASLPRAATA